MSTRNLPGGKGRPARKTDNLTAICEPAVQKMWEPRRLTTLRTSTAYYRNSIFTCFKIGELILLPSQCNCVFRMSLTINSDFLVCFKGASFLRDSSSALCVSYAQTDRETDMTNLIGHNSVNFGCDSSVKWSSRTRRVVRMNVQNTSPYCCSLFPGQDGRQGEARM
jgi:hypothetical protein